MDEQGRKIILLVDDEALIAAAGKLILEKAGYGVLTALSGEAAIETVDAMARIDLVLMDINLGRGIDGTEAAVRILERRELPLIFLSSHTEREIVERTEGITSYGYIVKDSGDTVLLASIRMAFRLFEAKAREREKTEAMTQLHELLSRQKKTLGILNEIITLANCAEDLSSLFAEVLHAALHLLDFDAGGIYIVDAAAGVARVVYHHDLPQDFVERVRTVSLDVSPYKELFRDGVPVITDHYEKIAPERARLTGFRSIVSVPLRSKDRIIGALNVISRRRSVASEEEKETLFAIGRELGTIIERIAAEEKSRHTAVNFETLFNSIEEMVFILDMDGNVIRTNETALRRLGYAAEELAGKSVLLVHIPERRDEALETVRGMIAGTRSLCTVPLITKGGERIDVETKVTRGLWNGREVLIGVTRDVGAQKRAEAALRESERNFKTLVENSPDIIVRFDRASRHIFVNDAIEAMTGTPAGYFLGKSHREIGQMPEDQVIFAEGIIRSVFETGTSVEFETVLQGKNGPIILMSRGVPEFDESGAVRSALFIHRDITERKKDEDRIRDLLREKDLVMREVHHRVKNNMNTVISLLSVQASSQESPATAKILNDAGERIRSMMLLYDKLYRSENVNALSLRDYIPDLLNAVVGAFAGPLSVRTVTRIEDVSLDAHTLSVLGIIVNELVANAMKYAFAGRAKGSIAVDAARRGERVVISVADDGVGAPEGFLEGRGAGFGLKLVRMLTEQLGGALTGEVKGGTKITLEFTA